MYLFDDDEIRTELEKYHISKSDLEGSTGDHDYICTRDIVKELSETANSGNNSHLMNADISDQEVKSTFGKGSESPGPDGVSAKLVDNADRTLMHECLRILRNKVWAAGCFPSEWKKENRIVIPKPGKAHYNECSAYRTVSVTSCLGKRLEHITSQRFITLLKSQNFDFDQFAYLKNKSVTPAILMVVEKIKKGLIQGQKAWAMFFDFTDAFGSVNRKSLLIKINRDFGVTGRLLLHIDSFLRDTVARIKIGDNVEEWIESLFGTSAGTSLGPLLFIAHVHDVPKIINPKFADDMVALAVGTDGSQIEESLQNATNQLVAWADKEGMELNAQKTKVMLFGDTVN